MSDLETLLDYDTSTGLFTWKRRLQGNRHEAFNTRYAGTKAGSTSSQGYTQIRALGKLYLAHRLALFFNTGEWPSCKVDHINGVKTDNRLSNLRAVDNKEHSRNMALMSHNTSGTTGVSYSKRDDVWVGFIHTGDSMIRNQFKSRSEAMAWRQAKEVELGYHPNHGLPKDERKDYVQQNPRPMSV